jgi:hypothetical protein
VPDVEVGRSAWLTGWWRGSRVAAFYTRRSAVHIYRRVDPAHRCWVGYRCVSMFTLHGWPAVCQVAATAGGSGELCDVCVVQHVHGRLVDCVSGGLGAQIYEITFPSTDDSCLHAHKAHNLTKTFVSRGQLGCRWLRGRGCSVRKADSEVLYWRHNKMWKRIPGIWEE